MTSCREAFCLATDPRADLPFLSDHAYLEKDRRPGQAKREPGPITTGYSVVRRPFRRFLLYLLQPVVMGPCVRRDDKKLGAHMTPTTSLLDRANLDRDSVRHQVARGLEGADDGELFLEYSQTEALMFDNGRLKQATYDTSQGFGLRAVKDDAVGYAHSSDVSLPALIRAADAVHAVRGGYGGDFCAAPPPPHCPALLCRKTPHP